MTADAAPPSAQVTGVWVERFAVRTGIKTRGVWSSHPLTPIYTRVRSRFGLMGVVRRMFVGCFGLLKTRRSLFMLYFV